MQGSNSSNYGLLYLPGVKKGTKQTNKQKHVFVGFSFLTIWDCIDCLVSRSKSMKDYFLLCMNEFTTNAPEMS